MTQIPFAAPDAKRRIGAAARRVIRVCGPTSWEGPKRGL
jgi:hypothetical protein